MKRKRCDENAIQKPSRFVLWSEERVDYLKELWNDSTISLGTIRNRMNLQFYPDPFSLPSHKRYDFASIQRQLTKDGLGFGTKEMAEKNQRIWASPSLVKGHIARRIMVLMCYFNL